MSWHNFNAAEELYRDLRFAARTLTRNPGFAAAATVTLALGIGANTAIFSTIDEALFRPLPLPHAEQLAAVYSINKATGAYLSVSYPDYRDFRAAQSFRELSAYLRFGLNVVVSGQQAETISIEAVSGNYFDMLQLPALLGRTLGTKDDVRGAEPVAMIGESLWRERFQADPRALGKTVTIEDRNFTIVGVVPKSYTGTNLNWGQPPRIWIALQSSTLVIPRFAQIGFFGHRAMRSLVLNGRLKPAVTPRQAQSELQIVAANLAKAEPESNRDITAVVFPLNRSKFWPAYRPSIARSLELFLAAAGLVLLLACANVSNLLLQRVLRRRREFAIRLSLGAARGRLLRQLMAENLLLVTPSFVVALAVGQGLARLLAGFPNTLGLRLQLDLSLEWRVFLFSMGLSLAATFLFGLAPALQGTRPEILPSLKESGSTGATSSSDWLRHSLVILQLAFCVLLLTAGGLFVRSLWKGYAVDIGFRPSKLLIAQFAIPQGSFSAERFRHDQSLLIERISHAPHVRAAALSLFPLLDPEHAAVTLSVAGGEPVAVNFDRVSPGYFQTIETGLLRGRDFAARDDLRSPKVAIINQTLAARLSRGGDAVGRTILLAGNPGSGGAERGRPIPAQIIGLARDAKYNSIWEDPRPHLYLPLLQAKDSSAGYLIVRTAGRPEGVAPSVREAWATISPRLPFDQFHTGDEQLNFALGPQRAAAALLAAFALLALVLAALGLYSAIAYWVTGRTREIGIRLAIGARPEVVERQVLRKALFLTALGSTIGIAATLASGRLIASQLKDVSPYDGWTLLAVALLVTFVALLAAWLPARSVTRIDPAMTLRGD